MKIAGFIKNWILPLSMLSGVASYFVAANLPFMAAHKESFVKAVNLVQPVLIFSMLFLSFCKVDPHCMRPRKWHIWLLLIQIGTFSLLSVIASLMSATANYRVLFEAAMICMICPTATAAAVVTTKLGGNANVVVSYTCLINMVVSLLVPAMVPCLHEVGLPELSFETSFLLILGKVFPLLIMPLVCAWFVRHLFPRVHGWIVQHGSIAFYLWAVALALAIGVTVKAVVHSKESLWVLVGIAAASLVCCLAQFWIGRKLGLRHGEMVAGTQSLGQKNTVFAIWMAYTFMNPVTAMAGGFYSVWHNVVNSWQLYRMRGR